MGDLREKLDWSMTVNLYHSGTYGHRIVLVTEVAGHGAASRTLGSWKGLGVPADVHLQAVALVDAALTEHLANRYGFLAELPLRWAGDPDPF